MKEKGKMHRAINLKTGAIKWFSDRLASKPEMLIEYGYMLQPMPKEDILEELKEKMDKDQQFISKVFEDQGIELEVETKQDKSCELTEVTFTDKPKRQYNKQNK